MNKKPLREKGKLKFSRHFQELKKGDKVALIRELSIPSEFPERLQGRTGVVEGRQGKVYIVKLNDMNREKTYLVAPIHLKKMETTK